MSKCDECVTYESIEFIFIVRMKGLMLCGVVALCLIARLAGFKTTRSIFDRKTNNLMMSSAKTMFDTFEGNAEGCYLYSRHSSPSNLYLDKALAAMEGTETANVSASGMGAITPTILQLCGQGDHVVSSRTIYGGTYAFLKNFAPRFGVKTTFVDITKLDLVEAAITPSTKVLYCETVSNPLLEVADIASLAKIAKKH